MKLTKAKLNRLLRKGIEELGYTFFKSRHWQGLYSKYIGDGFYLTLGLTIHRYYDDLFTGDLYLSRTTHIASTWRDIPNESYMRIGRLLTDKEREVYYVENTINGVKGKVDIWWTSSTEGPNCVTDFLKALKIAEPRMINQEGLKERIKNSVSANELLDRALKVIEVYKKKEFKGKYEFLPEKEINDIPLDWFKAAEEVIVDSGENLHKDMVNSEALNAFMMYELLPKK